MPEIENDEPRPHPVLRNSVGKPTGVLPRNAQTMTIVAISAVMIAAIAFSGTGSKTTPKPAPLPSSGVTDPNQARIAEYRPRLDEEARKLAKEQAQVLEARRKFADATGNPAPAKGALPLGRTDSSSPATQENDIDSDRRRFAAIPGLRPVSANTVIKVESQGGEACFTRASSSYVSGNPCVDVGKLNAKMSISVLGGSLPVDPTVGFDSSLGVANELKATLGVFCMGRPVGIAPPALTESKCYPTCVYNLHAREDCCSDTIR